MKIKLLFFLCLISVAGYAQKIKSIEEDGITIFYDTLGNPTKTLEPSSKKNIRTFNYKNTYDKGNHLISRTTYLDTIQVALSENQYIGNKLVRNDFKEQTNHGLSHKYVLYAYNDIDSLQTKTLCQNNGDTIKIISFFYNKDKKIERETEDDFQYKYHKEKRLKYGSLFNTIYENRVNVTTKDTISVSEKKVYLNKKGDLVKIEEWEATKSLFRVGDKDVSLSDEVFRNNRKGFLTVFTIAYKYDGFGNWIKATNTAKGKTISTESRNITYY